MVESAFSCATIFQLKLCANLDQLLRSLCSASLTWPLCRTHPADEVYVTGTFDDWSKSEKLTKTGDVFEKNVTLSSAEEKIYYKVR